MFARQTGNNLIKEVKGHRYLHWSAVRGQLGEAANVTEVDGDTFELLRLHLLPLHQRLSHRPVSGWWWLRVVGGGCEWLMVVAKGWWWLRVVDGSCEWLVVVASG